MQGEEEDADDYGGEDDYDDENGESSENKGRNDDY